MGHDLEHLGALGTVLSRRARAAGVVSILRAQSRSVRRVVVRDGRAESTSAIHHSGQGLQVVNGEGYGALFSRDDLREESALSLLDGAIAMAQRGPQLGLERAVPPRLPVERGRQLAGDPSEFAAVDLGQVTGRLVELEREIRAMQHGINTQLHYRAELDAWRILRSDGTDVLYSVPRCTIGMRATSDGDGGRHGVSAVVFDTTPLLLQDRRKVELFLKRAGTAARLAQDLPDAPPHAAGCFPLVIDYALAKGLAHEAFGHAAEADGYRSSVLARDGRFRVGERVGADHVSIIDEAIERDHAWQPYSANGLTRRTAVLVDHGRLHDGLSDPWSAVSGGVALSGAARAESFRQAPQPRMSNIRIEVDDPLDAPGEFEDYDPGRVRELLAESGVFRRHGSVVYLSGYSGGQVNTATGDFVFHCKAIYDLSPRGIELFKPAIFSGSMFGALESVREAFGPLKLDALGYCGKWGQSVPSSGGSHYFSFSIPTRPSDWGAAEVDASPLLEALGAVRPAGMRIRDWSVYLTSTSRLSLGVKDLQAGNPHAPLTVSHSAGAQYLLVWGDGRISRGYLERRDLENPSTALAQALPAAYEDPDAAYVVGPGEIPELSLHDGRVAAIPAGDTSVVSVRLERMRACMAQHRFRTWSASFSAAEGEDRLLTSAGLDVAERGTSAGWHVNIQGEIGDGFVARSLEEDDEFEARLERVTRLAMALGHEAEAMKSGMHRVLLHPRVVESFVLNTLLANLDGATVAHGEGHFRFEQFGSDDAVLRDDLSLRLDPLLPLCSGSYRFTREGVPAAACTYIDHGRLVSPLLNLKYSRRLGLSPTPLPYSKDTLFFEGSPLLPLPRGLERARGGVLVLSALGVHTQDKASGDFSLSSPQVLRIGPGGFAGRLKATISGNLFELLTSDALALVAFDGEHTPGLLVECRMDPK